MVDSIIEVQIPFLWVFWSVIVVGIVGIAFGVFTALLPKRCIDLYGWMMGRINWYVKPIDHAREVRTTRLFGVVLLLSGILTLQELLIYP